jgi:hypothetical protein
MNDDVYEFIENFTAQLNLAEAADRVTIDPDSAQVQILDDDSKLQYSCILYSALCVYL